MFQTRAPTPKNSHHRTQRFLTESSLCRPETRGTYSTSPRELTGERMHVSETWSQPGNYLPLPQRGGECSPPKTFWHPSKHRHPLGVLSSYTPHGGACYSQLGRAVRRRTGGRRRRWVVLWPAAAAARSAFFIGGGVALWSAAAVASTTG